MNIPHIILAHMHKTENSFNFSFPYAHIITCILMQEGIDLNMPIWGVPTNENEFAEPENLFHHLKSTGWVEANDGIIVPGPFHRNAYLFRPNAKVNQYEEIGNEPLHVPSGRAAGQGLNPEIAAYIDEKFVALNTKVDERFNKLEQCVARNQEDLHKFWASVDLNFKKLLSKGSGSGGGNDEGEEE